MRNIWAYLIMAIYVGWCWYGVWLLLKILGML